MMAKTFTTLNNVLSDQQLTWIIDRKFSIG